MARCRARSEARLGHRQDEQIGKELLPGRPALSAGRRARRRDRRPVAAQAAAGPVPSLQRRASSPAAGSSASRSTTSTPTASARSRARRSTSSRPARSPRPTGAPSPSILDYVPLSAGAGALKAAVERAEQALGAESRRVHYLSVPPNAALSAVQAAGRGRARRALPHHHGEAVRHRPRQRRWR